MTGKPQLSSDRSETPPPGNRKAIWSLGHAGRPDFDEAAKIVDLGVRMRIHGIEIEPDIAKGITYDRLPDLAAAVDREAALAHRNVVRRIAAYAKEKGLRVSQWLHELSGPPSLLDVWPELSAEDGFLDLESPNIARLIRAQIDEYFEAVPEVDDVTLTLTETQVCALHRPYSDMPLVERAKRVLNAVIEAVRPHGKGLIVRPFSALDEDYEATLAALEDVAYEKLSVMEKTEPYDWNPFLPDSPYLRRVGGLELRAEADAGAEYYGQTMVPACYPRYLTNRLRSAMERGATTFVLRADRCNHPTPGTLNEINLVAATAWIHEPMVDLGDVWKLWLESRLGAAPEGLAELLEQTFEVIKNSLYIDRQQISHDRFPDFEHAKHVQMFHLFEPAANLRHMRDHWSMLADRPTPDHAQVLHEKEQAVRMAEALETWFDSFAPELNAEAVREVRRALGRGTLLARGTLALARIVLSHLEEAWSYRNRTASSFDEEACRLESEAERIAGREGEAFFADMAARMRSHTAGLRKEREIELPRREALGKEERLVDYVLCGLASEGHKLSKRLHTGAARVGAGIHYRQSGLGEREGFSYEIGLPKEGDARLEMTLIGADRPVRGESWLGPHKFELKTDAGEGEKFEFDWHVPAGSVSAPARIEIWSKGSVPCRVAEIRVYES